MANNDICIQNPAKENDIDDAEISIPISTSKVTLSKAVNALNSVLQWAED